ncbi:carbohydrate kinase family protein [Actinoplanes sp. NPDC049599]|uniref:carbohydrate kinase family protein n=1 Tax=Actinoplanes sp. NPDC049599 TaxID=3363903 RepID=UPI0037A28BB6
MVPPRVYVVGPVSWNLLVHVAELPPAEPHTVFAGWHHECLGGTSAGKALNLRRLGLGVSLCTLLGDDDTGETIRRALRPSGIDLLVRRSGNGSERHVNLMDPAGRRLSVYLTLPEAAAPVPARQAAVLADADAVVVDLADHSRQALPAARALGKPVWCDLHDYDGRSAFHAEFLAAADYLFVSDERLPDPHRFLREQVAAGKRLAVCTRGARGALALVPGGEIVEVAAAPVAEVVDTNGAGDAFFAGFLSAHLAGAPLGECLDLAATTAAACVSSPELAAGD